MVEDVDEIAKVAVLSDDDELLILAFLDREGLYEFNDVAASKLIELLGLFFRHLESFLPAIDLCDELGLVRGPFD